MKQIRRVVKWESKIPDRSNLTLNVLIKYKKELGTWKDVGEVLNINANALAVRYSKLNSAHKKEVQSFQ